MNAFSFYNPVKLIFGKDQLAKLKGEFHHMEKKFLLFMAEEVLRKMVYMIGYD